MCLFLCSYMKVGMFLDLGEGGSMDIYSSFVNCFEKM